MKSFIRFPSQVLKPIREYLMREQQKLLKRRDELRQEDPFENEDRVNDNADLGQEASEQWGHQRVEALGREIDKGLIRIRKSLTRIKLGKYGLCEICGDLIDTDRLAIYPTASLCFPCETNKSAAAHKSKPKKTRRK